MVLLWRRRAPRARARGPADLRTIVPAYRGADATPARRLDLAQPAPHAVRAPLASATAP